MRLKSFFILVFVVSPLFVYGCLPLKEVHRPNTHFYCLEYNQEYSCPKKLPYILEIKRFSVSSEYDTLNIVYQENRYEYQNYPYHKWRTNPGVLISSRLRKDFIASKGYQAVIGEKSQSRPTHNLEGSVDAIYEKDTEKGWYAVLTLTVTLEQNQSSNEDCRVLFQDSFTTKKMVDKKDPLYVVKAMSSAMNELSLKIQKRVYQILSK